MQNIIQEKMKNIQNAIIQCQPEESRVRKSGLLHSSTEGNLNHHIHKENPKFNNYNNAYSHVPSEHSPNDASFTSNTDIIGKSCNVSEISNLNAYEQIERSVPLFNVNTRCLSVNKKRRTRRDRGNHLSLSKDNSAIFERKSSLVNLRSRQYPRPKFQPLSTKSAKKPNKIRKSFLTKEKTYVHFDNNVSMSHKKIQLDKMVQMITRRTFEVLSRIRPANNTVKTVKWLFKLIYSLNNQIKLINYRDPWNKLCTSLLSHSHLILHEIKYIPQQIAKLSDPPEILNEINDELFRKTQKNAPSWSSAFQKEWKPISNFLASLLNFFDMADRSNDRLTNNSCTRSSKKEIPSAISQRRAMNINTREQIQNEINSSISKSKG